jgi:hypothetical protein
LELVTVFRDRSDSVSLYRTKQRSVARASVRFDLMTLFLLSGSVKVASVTVSPVPSMWDIKNQIQKTLCGKKLTPGEELFGEEFTPGGEPCPS